MSTIKSNIIFDIANNITKLAFPIITFPYISRVLSPEGIGQVNFCQSIILYIVLFVALGIPTYGVREISKIKGDRHQLTVFTIELFLLHCILSIIGYIFSLFLLFIPQISNLDLLYIIASFHIIFEIFSLSWFFQGIEDFKYITIRALFIRILSIILLFSFVKDKNDAPIYMLILLISEVGNNLFNIIYVKKYLFLKNISRNEIHVIRHLKPTCYLFMLTISTMIYFNTDIIMIGFIKDTEAVGYYIPAIKIQRLLMTFVLSISTVFFPRLSSIKDKSSIEFFKLCNNGLSLILLLGFPIVAGLFVIGDDIIYLFSGIDYKPSIKTLYFLAPVIIFGTISNFLSKILICQNKESIVLKSTTIGALVNIILNLFFIQLFSHTGAAMTSVISEIFVLASMIILGNKFLPKLKNKKEVLKYILSSAIMVLIVFEVKLYIHQNILLSVFLSILIGIFIYFLMLFISKEKILFNYISLYKK